MAKFHVILEDELGEEFSVELEAHDRAERSEQSSEDAWDTVQRSVASKALMDYPESSVVHVSELKRYVREY